MSREWEWPDDGPWPRLNALAPPPAWLPGAAHLDAASLRLAQHELGVEVGTIEGPPRGLVVGEAPSSSTSARLPLFPWPRTSSAGRLLAWSGMTPAAYLGRLRRVNLHMMLEVANGADRHADHRRAIAILDLLDDDLEHRRSSTKDAAPLRVLLLGQRVAKAFGFDRAYDEREIRGHVVKTCPHPSARSTIGNDVDHQRAIGIAARWCAGYMGDDAARPLCVVHHEPHPCRHCAREVTHDERGKPRR